MHHGPPNSLSLTFTFCDRVDCAAERLYPNYRYLRPMLLSVTMQSSQIVSRVAEEDQKILTDPETTISKSKSLISISSGAFEFAKQFFLKYGTVDVSPISMGALMMCRTTHGLHTIRKT